MLLSYVNFLTYISHKLYRSIVEFNFFYHLKENNYIFIIILIITFKAVLLNILNLCSGFYRMTIRFLSMLEM